MKVVVDGKFNLWDLRELIDNADYVRGESLVPEEFWKKGAYHGRCWSEEKPSWIYECFITIEDEELAKEMLSWAVDRSKYVPPLKLEVGSGKIDAGDLSVSYKAWVSVEARAVPDAHKVNYLLVESDGASFRDILVFNQDMLVLKETDEELVLAGGSATGGIQCRIFVTKEGKGLLVCERSSGQRIGRPVLPNVVEEDALFVMDLEVEGPPDEVEELHTMVEGQGMLALEESEALKKAVDRFHDVVIEKVIATYKLGKLQIRGKIKVNKLFKYPFICKSS